MAKSQGNYFIFIYFYFQLGDTEALKPLKEVEYLVPVGLPMLKNILKKKHRELVLLNKK